MKQVVYYNNKALQFVQEYLMDSKVSLTMRNYYITRMKYRSKVSKR